MKERLTIKFDEKSNLVGYRWSNPKVEHKDILMTSIK